MSFIDTIKETFGLGKTENTHPALSNYSRPLEMGKHVAKSSIKGAAKWAIGVGIAAAAITMLTPVGWIGAAASAVFGVQNVVLAAGLAGISAGATAGAVLGGLKGVTTMDEAADAREEQLIFNHGRMASRAMASNMMAAQTGQQMGGLASPALGFGQTQSQFRNM